MFDTIKSLFGWPWFPRRKPDPKPLPEKETDLSYGSDPLQKLDVYRPPNTMPGDRKRVILMVHGGGWDNTLGDKANDGVIDAKVAHYTALGYVVFSINYRLYPQVTPLQEAQDVAAALAFVQKQPGVDPARVVLMGHSAGGHLVALATVLGAKVAGTVCLDSIYDVELAIRTANKTGNKQAIALYAPFGTDPEQIKAASPIDNVNGPVGPMLLCYSTQEGPQREKQANNFAAIVEQEGGVRPVVQGFDLSHGDMDAQVGLPGPLTDAIDGFLAALP